MNMVGNLSISGTPKNQHESGSSKQGQKKYKKTGNKNFGPKNNNNKFKRHQTKGGKMLCSFCDSPKHLQKAYPGFKEWLKEQGKCDVVSFIDELFLADFPLILGGLTQVPLCTSLIHYRYSVRSEL